jgi:hypothetical protein
MAKVGSVPVSSQNWALFVVKPNECPEISKIGLLWSGFVSSVALPGKTNQITDFEKFHSEYI